MTIQWKGGNGDFNVASNWVGGQVPEFGDDVSIGASGIYTVSVDTASAMMGSIAIVSTATLAISGYNVVVNQLNTGSSNAGTITVGSGGSFACSTASKTLSNSGDIVMDDGGLFSINGTLVNSGEIELKKTASSGILQTNGGATIQGGGVIAMEGGTLGDAAMSPFNDPLENVDDVIVGAGSLTAMSFTNDAQGFVEAAGSGKLDVATGNRIENLGTMEAVASGFLDIHDAVDNTGTLAATGGTLYAEARVTGGALTAGVNGSLYLFDMVKMATTAATGQGALVALIDATFAGGSLADSAGGQILATTVTFDGSASTVSVGAGTVALDEQVSHFGSTTSYLTNTNTMLGTIDNRGSIRLQGTHADVTLLVGNAGVTLTGAGSILLDGNAHDIIEASAQNNLLTNESETIVGGGVLGAGLLWLKNSGVVDATSTTAALTLKLTQQETNINSGTLEAGVGGDLELMQGTLTNSGTVASAGTVRIGGTAIISNLVAGTLTGGVWSVTAASQAALLSLSGGAITTDAATISLSGQHATLQAGNGSTQTGLEQSLVAITTKGELDVALRSYTTTNALALDGALGLGGGVFTSGQLSASSTARISGFGTVSSSLTDAGAVVAAATLTLAFTGVADTFTGALSGGGTIAFTAGTDALNSGVTLAAATTRIAGATVSLGTSLSNAGILALASGSLGLGTATLTQQGGAALSGGSITGAGKLIVSGATTLGNVAIGGTTLLRNNGSVSETGTITLGDGTNGAAQLTNASGKTWTIQGDVGITAGSAAATFNNGGGTLSKASGTGISAVSTNMVNLAGAAAAITVASGTLNFTGASNNFVADTIAGAGTFAIGGGGTSTIGTGTTIATAAWSIGKVGTTVVLGTSLSYGGSFSDTNQTTLNLGANTLTLSGAAAFNLGPGGAPIVTGTGKLILNGSSTTIGGLALGGGTLLRDNGTVSQTGTVTVGDSTNGAALLTIGAGGVWQIAGDVGIAAGSSGAFVNVGGGYLAKTAGSGTSLVAPGIENLSTSAGTIRAKVGTLELGGALTGALNLVVNGGATLQLDKAASAGTAASFVGAGGTLVLNDAQDFKGSITGFGAGQKLDLASIGYTSPGTVLTYAGSTLTVAGGGKTASLAIGTGYTASSFHLANDTHGGSLVTYG